MLHVITTCTMVSSARTVTRRVVVGRAGLVAGQFWYGRIHSSDYIYLNITLGLVGWEIS